MNGIQLNSKKQYLISWAIHQAKTPSRVRLEIEPGSEVLVQSGDLVKTGQKIARAVLPSQVDSHASVSGRVMVKGFVVEVETSKDAREIWTESIGVERPHWQQLSREELLTIFQSAGLTAIAENPGTSLHQKISRAPCLAEDVLTLNACEGEPYVTSLQSLVMSHPVEVLKGAEILRKAYGAGKIQIVIESSKEETIELLKSKIYFLKWEHVQVRSLSSSYPQVLENRQTGDFNVLENAATAFAVYEAVVRQKPFFERVVTVGGECVPEPKNVWIRMGTSLEEVFKNAKGFLRDPRKVLVGGPMKGLAVPSLEFTVTSETSAVLALPPEVAREEEVQPCIKCGRCLEVCPEDLSPAMITLAAENQDFETAEFYGANACTECGNCAYVCPSKRPMVALIRSVTIQGNDFKKSAETDDLLKTSQTFAWV